MNVFKVTLATVAVAALPLASSWAAGGTSGGGMSTGSGKKAGGLSKENKVTTTGASQ
jgi:hypothetical protein